MKILAVIPARKGSKGLRSKNLTLLNGYPLIHYTTKACVNSKLVDKTVVSTDSDRIAAIAKNLGAQVINRPKQLSHGKAPIEPVIQHVLDNLKNKKKYSPDIIVLLQNTSPLRDSKDIDGVLSVLIKGKYDSALSGFPYHTFVWNVEKDSSIIPHSYDPQNRLRRQET
ncbi:uncharacterized protein METZ01_LOCUS516855, partial [marine metagenome]